MNKDTHKIFQLMDFFVNNHGYSNLYIKEFAKDGTVFLYDGENKNYQLIRITTDPLDNEGSDQYQIKRFINECCLTYKISQISFLDIHISTQTVSGYEEFDTSTIDSDFHSGIELEDIYPGIYKIVKDVTNQEAELKDRINSINAAMKAKQQRLKNNSFLSYLKFSSCPITLIISIISIILYLVYKLYFARHYSESASLIALGADYKIFTLGLKEFYRLITSAFLHSSLLHLTCNLISFLTFGAIIEPLVGKIKFLIMFFCGVLTSSLTHGILSGNSLVVGLSGGIYALFAFFIMYFINKGYLTLGAIMPTIIINLFINFMPNVSWQGHLGGAICGIIFYYLFENRKTNIAVIPVMLILIGGLLFKYIKDFNIRPFYGATDFEVVEIANDLGNYEYASKISKKLYMLYLGGEKD